MKKPSRVLLLKNQLDTPIAYSWIVDEYGFHRRTIQDAGQLGVVVRSEPLDMIIVDQRGAADRLIEVLKMIRRDQPEVKLFVICDAVGLNEVQQAMRMNVQDIFLPPFSLNAVVTGIEEIWAQISGRRPYSEKDAIRRWTEVAAALESPSQAAPLGEQKSGEDQPRPAAETDPRLDEAVARIGDLENRLKESLSMQDSFRKEVERLTVEATKLRSADERARQLESEVASLRERAVRLPTSAPVHDNTLRKELAEAKIRIADLETERQKAAAGLGNDSAAARSEEVEELRRSLEAARKDAAAAAKALRDCESLLSAAAGEAAKTEEERDRAHAEIAALKDEIQSLRAGAGDSEAETSLRREALSKRERELDEQRDAVVLQEQALRELAKMLDERESELNEQAEQLEQLRAEVEAGMDSLLGEAENLTASLERLEANKRALAARMDGWKSREPDAAVA